MLVLTRKVDQGIVIAGNIYIRVLGVERDRVKIGIAAPKEIVVLREELLEREHTEPGRGGNSIGSGNSAGAKNSTGTKDSESPAPSAIDTAPNAS